jgi:hypothetical protein
MGLKLNLEKREQYIMSALKVFGKRREMSVKNSNSRALLLHFFLSGKRRRQKRHSCIFCSAKTLPCPDAKFCTAARERGNVETGAAAAEEPMQNNPNDAVAKIHAMNGPSE